MLSANASAPKDATKATISVNNQVKEDLPFSDKKYFENAQKVFCSIDPLLVKDPVFLEPIMFNTQD